MDLEKYIEKIEYNPDIDDKKIWLHNLPNDETLFDIIEQLRKKYKNETFVITQIIDIENKIIDEEVILSNCFFLEKVNFLDCVFNKTVIFERTNFKKAIFVKSSTFFERVLFDSVVLNNFYEGFPKDVFNFDNTTFEDSIFCSQTSFTNISFDNVSFKKGKEKKSEFILCSFYYVTFSNTIFEEYTYFEKNNRVENISFKNTTFFGKTEFGYLSFIGKTFFLNCIFNPLTNSSDEEVLFSGSIFEGKTDFTGSKFNVKTNFSYSDSYFFEEPKACHFKDDVNFKNCTFAKKTDFSETFFEGNSNFSETIFGKTEDSSSYEISFNDAKFNKVARFHSCNFYSDTKFENTSFNTLVDFYLSVFHKEQLFLRTDFLDIAVFSGVVFKKQIQFLYCKVKSNSYINFESCVFKEYLDISRANFNCNLNFWNVKIEDKIRYINTYTKYENDFGKYDRSNTIIKPVIYTKIRESFRIMKDNSYKQNNRIEGLNFYEKEMSIYLEENRCKNHNSENTFLGLKNLIKFLANKKKNFNDSLPLKRCFTNENLNVFFSFLLILLYLPFCVFTILLSPVYFTALLIHKITNIEMKEAMFFLTNIIFLGLYIFTKDFIWYIFFMFLFLYMLYLIPNFKRNILHSIKENNYISLIIFFICVASILVAAYGAPNQDNYILLWKEKILSFDNNNLTFISYISFIIIAILFATIFKKSEKILLWFNKNSNNFGTNWFIGVNFTTLVALITYVVITLFSSNVTLQLNAEGVGNFLKALVDVLNLTDWNDMTILGKKLNNWQYITLFIGRIFIAYGIYQTVQAFRKYGKS